MFTTKTILYLLIFISECFTRKVYNNYTLYRGIPVTVNDLEFFKNMSVYDVNFWKRPGFLHRPVDFVVPPEKKREFVREALVQGVYFKTVLEDVQSAFDMQTVKSYVRRNMDSFDWRSYFRFDDISEWLRDLKKTYPKVLHLERIGTTYEKREIMVARIVQENSKPRAKVIVEGGIHAREWISVAFVTYFLHQILTAPASDNKLLKKISRNYEWYFVPVLNPDGYEYTHTTDRMYRKNLRKVDLNRNFGIAFGTIGVSHNDQSEIYCGAKAFSEPESKALGRFLRTKNNSLLYYLSFHSYGQYIIIPYAYSSMHHDNFDEVHAIGTLAADAIQRRYGTVYTVGTAYDTVGYMTSGVSGCWVKKVFGTPYVLTFELRDDGEFGFALPTKQILPTCEETMDGVLSILTPRVQPIRYQKKYENRGHINMFLDGFVVLWNVILFFIFRFG